MPTTPESRIKIQVNNLTKRFGDLTVLDGINFNIKEGELLAIVGPTGCGKTTFLNTLSKLMPATEGEILIDGLVWRVGQWGDRAELAMMAELAAVLEQ